MRAVGFYKGRVPMPRWSIMPITSWLPAYDRRWLRSDIIAGLTVWALVVPQAIAYAQIRLKSLSTCTMPSRPSTDSENRSALKLCRHALK